MSPQSGVPCVLPDTRKAHHAGHESAYVDNGRAVWASTWDDHVRWATADVAAVSEQHEEKHAKRRARGCPKCLDSDRVVQAEAFLRAVKARRPAETARLILAVDDLTARPSIFAGGGLVPDGVHIGAYIGPPPAGGAALAQQVEADLLARRRREKP